MKRFTSLLFLCAFFLHGCKSATPSAPAEPLLIQYTAGSVPWLAVVYGCEGIDVINVDQRSADLLDIRSFDMAIRIGQPDKFASPAYQIGTEDILVVVNRQNPINSLTAEQVRELFTGETTSWQESKGADTYVQVWGYFPGEDIQQIFDQFALGGRRITSTARLAANPDEMAQAIAGDKNAVGIIPRHWKLDNVSVVFTVARVPVLALTASQPKAAVQNLLSCLQK